MEKNVSPVKPRRQERRRPAILVVCMVDSIHVARWLQQFKDEKYDFHIFPSGPNRKIHARLRDLAVSKSDASFNFHRTAKFNLHIWLADKCLRGSVRRLLLSRYVKLVNPDFVHAIEFQQAGYLSMSALEAQIGENLPLMVTNWGSDIFWFRRFPVHEKKIRKLLGMAKYYSAECERDVLLARNHGFNGTAFPVIPNAGGINVVSTRERTDYNQSRNLVSIKGYDGWVGRAGAALRALPLLKVELANLKIIVFSANLKTRVLAWWIQQRHRIEVIVHSKNALSHSQVQEIFRKSLVYVGVSESDGISTSMLEAMASGAIPVQTATACCKEWFVETGVQIDRIDSSSVADAITRGLQLARNEENQRRNIEIIEERASVEKVKAAAIAQYQTILKARDRVASVS